MKMTIALNNPLQNSNKSLGDSLRIREFENKEVNNLLQGHSLDAGQETDKTKITQVTASITETAKFAYDFYRKCIESKIADEEACYLLTEGVLSAASEISNRLGQEKGAEFLGVISEATEAGLDENLLSVAISNFFEQFRDEARKDQQDGKPAQTNMLSKLIHIEGAMNKGLGILIDKEKMLPERLERGEKPGLAFAMNNFFSTDFTVAENGGYVTTKGFSLGGGPLFMDRIEGPYAKELEWQENGPLGPGQYLNLKIDNNITAQEFSGAGNSGIISKVADYLRTGIGNEKAAAYLENMADDSKIIDAMNATISIVAMENGFDKASEYVNYLNGDFKNAVNSVAKESMFDGWILHAPDKTSKPQGSGLTMHYGGPGGMDGIFQKGHLALDNSWRMIGGPGMGIAPIDLNDLYATLAGAR